ncbi:DNA/RNA non-specific endonuclease [Lampropedia puyangensis]|uniref:DNA/RNA non-specific endonuclease n=1 Tax=Lampropedia puyangensis TaxID=1330072 RepID=A0A4S8FCF1_9BURK|nr:DNA/RNA non-specific endonuclease [Lampropedia puyangensis]THU05009.1 DNA/RNA non-specific endonuclease [Lampropedia puyangensis]
MSASRKKSQSIRRKGAAKNRSVHQLGTRFWKSLLLSTFASFSAASCALKLPWLQRIEHEAQALQEPAQWISAWLHAIWQEPLPQGLRPSADGTAMHSHNTTDFAECRGLFPAQQVPVLLQAPRQSYALCFDAFAILYNADTKTPAYVVERLNRDSLQAAQAINRTDRFYAEARLPSHARAQLDDYRGSGYSRGHMAPAGDMPSPQAMAQSFSLANMVPQNQSHNSGAWNKIEQDTRKYAMRARADVFVFTGPAYKNAVPAYIGSSRVAVPSHVFKLVYDASTGRAWAHWQQNQAGGQPLKPITYQELVDKTRIAFLPTPG